MKAILFTILSAICFTLSASAQTSSEIPLGPRMLVYALAQADSGTLQIESTGIKNPPSIMMVDIKRNMSSSKILEAFNFEDMKLRFTNPNEYVMTRGEILDRDGKVLFRAEHWWKCQKSFNEKGKAIYQVPEYAGNLWFALQDISLLFTGKSAKAYLNGGEIITLDVVDGQVTVPGFLAYSQGVLEVTKDDQKTFFDLQTGGGVKTPTALVSSQGIGFDNLQSLGEVQDSVQIQTYQGNQTVYEGRSVSNGTLSITTQEEYIYAYDSQVADSNASSNVIIDPYPYPAISAPAGMWLFVKNENEWKYFTPKNGTFTVPVQKGEVVYFYFTWNDGVSGKG